MGGGVIPYTTATLPSHTKPKYAPKRPFSGELGVSLNLGPVRCVGVRVLRGNYSHVNKEPRTEARQQCVYGHTTTHLQSEHGHPDPAPIWVEISIHVPLFRPFWVLLFQQQKREKPLSLYRNYPPVRCVGVRLLRKYIMHSE